MEKFRNKFRICRVDSLELTLAAFSALDFDIGISVQHAKVSYPQVPVFTAADTYRQGKADQPRMGLLVDPCEVPQCGAASPNRSFGHRHGEVL